MPPSSNPVTMATPTLRSGLRPPKAMGGGSAEVCHISSGSSPKNRAPAAVSVTPTSLA